MSSFRRKATLASVLFTTGLLAACGLIPLPDIDAGDPLKLDGRSIALVDMLELYPAETPEGEGSDGGTRQLLVGMAPGAAFLTGVTSEELATIVARHLNISPGAAAPGAFQDIPASAWTYRQIAADSREQLTLDSADRANRMEARRSAREAYLAAQEAARRAGEPDFLLPLWFSFPAFKFDPADVDLSGPAWVTGRISSFTQPVSLKQFTLQSPIGTLLPDTLQVRASAFRLILNTETAGGPSPLFTAAIDSDEPITFTRDGNSNRYLPAGAAGVGQLQLTSDAQQLVQALKGSDPIIIALDLGLIVDTSASEVLNFVSVTLGAGNAIVSF